MGHLPNVPRRKKSLSIRRSQIGMNKQEKKVNKFFQSLAGAAACFMMIATAAQAEGLRIRGEVTGISGDSYTILNASGQSTTVKLSEPVVLEYKDIAFEDIGSEAYVSVPSIPLDGNSFRALGVTVFPDPMRGLNEGFSDWDLTSGSKMTNATIARVVSRGGERILTLSFQDDQQVVVVPETAPVTTFGPNPDRRLKKGDLVVVFADGKDGNYTGKYVGVHVDGTLPPV